MELSSDLSRALRSVLRRPWHPLLLATVIGVASSAAGILGAAVWELVFHPLPFADATKLVVMRGTTDLLSKTDVDRLRGLRSLSGLASFRQADVQRRTNGASEQVSVTAVDSSFFSLLGVRPLQGRLLVNDDFHTTASPGAVVSEAFAARNGGTRTILGRSVTLDAETFVVVGVAPGTLQLPRNTDLWLPDRRHSSAFDVPQYWALGRLSPHASMGELRAESQTLGVRSPIDARTRTSALVHVEDALSFVRGETRSESLTTAVVVSVVILLTLGTLASVFTARLVARAHVVALQRALGASTAALFRQYLTETAAIGGLGIVVGLMVSAVVLRALGGQATIREWWPAGLYVNLRVVCCVAVAGGLFSLVLAGIQALHVSRSAGAVSMLRSAGTTTSAASARNWRAALLGAEIALVMCLLVISGVLVRSFVEWDALPWGYDVDHIGFAVVDLPQGTFQSAAARIDVAERLRDDLRRTPDLAASAVFGLSLPMWTSQTKNYVELDRYDHAALRFGPVAPQSIMDVDSSYFSVLEIPTLRGRSIQATDGPTSEPVIVIDETLAKRNWPGLNPIGRLMRFPAMEPNGPWYRVVGVVKNALPISPAASLIAHGSIRVGVAYRSLAQVGVKWPDHGDPQRAGLAIVFRMPNNESGRWAKLRATLAAVVPDQPIEHLGTLRAYYESGFASDRLRRSLLTGAATALGLLLSLAGIAALVIEAVARRTREIGIRVALGAPRRQILTLAIEGTSGVACIGVCVGLVLALAISNVFGHYIFGIGRGVDEPGLLFVASTGLLAVVIAVSLIPAMRALRISPADALRAE